MQLVAFRYRVVAGLGRKLLWLIKLRHPSLMAKNKRSYIKLKIKQQACQNNVAIL
jgi:hypothetical protein